VVLFCNLGIIIDHLSFLSLTNGRGVESRGGKVKSEERGFSRKQEGSYLVTCLIHASLKRSGVCLLAMSHCVRVLLMPHILWSVSSSFASERYNPDGVPRMLKWTYPLWGGGACDGNYDLSLIPIGCACVL